MGKKHVVVVSSSDDEKGSRPRSTRSSNSCKTKSRPSVPRVNLRSSKKARISDSFSGSCKESRGVEEVSFDSLNEDFYECLRGCKKVSGREAEELWVDKYKPQSLGELAVHRKKVEEVKTWLEEWLRMSKDNFHGNALLISGQAGVGKSATVHVIASHLGVSVCEWNTPTPTLWQEHMHNAHSGIQYMSKLDEFESFVERMRKYPLLPLASTEGSKKQVILLIDDLPLTNGRVAYGRLSNCLHVLVRSTQIPTVILITEYGKADTSEPMKLDWEGLKSSLESAGASKVSFNPVTVNSIKKMLSRICKEEHCNMTDEQIVQIAKSSGGDIRNAITSLQYLCLRSNVLLLFPSSTLSTSYSKENPEELSLLNDRFPLPFGRDETLSLFHALGKFLHNKRETVGGADLEEDIFRLREKFARLPLKMEAPEKILDQAHGKARPIADFLHENVLDFISDQAVDDAWAISSYLSDADCLLATSLHPFAWSQMINSNNGRDSIGEEAAASIAVRGVLFGNSHASSSRWHSIRSPKLWQIELSSRQKKNEMLRQRSEAYNSLSLSDINVMVTEYLPVQKWLELRTWEDDYRDLGGFIEMAGRPKRHQYKQEQEQKQEQSRAKWTTSLTKTLADLMVEQVLKGNRPNHSFGSKAWKNICDEFHRETGLKWNKEQLKNRYGAMRRQYVTVKLLLNHGDFSWDEATGTITAPDEVWDEYIKGNTDAEAIRNNGCQIYKQLCTVFSESGPNGNHHTELDEQTPGLLMDIPAAPAEESSSPSEDEDVDVSNIPNKHGPLTPPSSGHRKRGRKGIDRVMSEAILEMAAASRLRTAAATSIDQFSINNCIKALDEIDGLEESIYFASLDLFDSPNARETFLSLRTDRRLTWLKAKYDASARSTRSLGRFVLAFSFFPSNFLWYQGFSSRSFKVKICSTPTSIRSPENSGFDFEVEESSLETIANEDNAFAQSDDNLRLVSVDEVDKAPTTIVAKDDDAFAQSNDKFR
ncbi:hypothetical protein NE237_024045 [Protea cynaroides]|uniref:Myb/SANT-like domain-containing protein n=1 Tax=Protea cynaroides TaxID=273540 RepID=A0A9Q0HF44_9MAGN|nr:hypothetical protein NE237_024045 [Protea cynaroides]